MIRLECDYAEGAHERVLRRLFETNLEQTPGYGEDLYCARAQEYIQQLCQREGIDVHFLVGGTQTNTTVIAAALRPHQGVIAATSGHINVHETGAIEATGHKVLAVPSADGKLTGREVRRVYESHWQDATREHMVQPGMVYISFPTEIGSLYTKKELKELSAACHENGIPLYIDGARMGYGLTSPDADVTLQDIASLCDMFYIGGTKCGAVMGEALVITNPALKEGFRYTIKQHGGLLAKGRYLGIQFDVLFEDDLYFTICKKAVEQSMAIRRAFEEKGIQMDSDSSTNQQFPILTCEQMDKLAQKYSYEIWEEYDETHTVVRFCTSWATQDQNVQQLLEDIRAL